MGPVRALKRQLPELDVTLVDSRKIPIIGVGEATQVGAVPANGRTESWTTARVTARPPSLSSVRGPGATHDSWARALVKETFRVFAQS
jgi:hypothetical protein